MFSKNPYRKIGLFLAVGFTALAMTFIKRGHQQNHHAHQHALQHQEHPAVKHHGDRQVEEQRFGAGHAASLVYTPAEDIALKLPQDLAKDRKIEIPTFPGCEEEEYKARLQCTFKKYGSFIRRHLQQPQGRTGRAIVIFTVDLAGQIEDAELYKKTDPFLAAETMRLVGIMQGADMRWSPGKVNGTPRALKMALAVIYGKGCDDCAEVTVELYPVE